MRQPARPGRLTRRYGLARLLQHAVQNLLFKDAKLRIAALTRAGQWDALIQRNAAVFNEDDAVGEVMVALFSKKTFLNAHKMDS